MLRLLLARARHAPLLALATGALAAQLLGCSDATQTAGRAFPSGFLWGSAVAAFQTEMGGGSASIDRNTDWFAWTHDSKNLAAGRITADLPENGPASYERYPDDYALARSLDNNAYRLSIEWSRFFPSSTAGVAVDGVQSEADLQALDALANQAEVAHARTILHAAREAGLEPMLTLQHFSLPLWIHEPIAARDAFLAAPAGTVPQLTTPGGWLDATAPLEFAKFAAYAAWKLGDEVDLWVTINEPVVMVVSGYVNIAGVGGNFPPGAFSLPAVPGLLVNLVTAHARAYSAVKRWDTVVASQAHGGILDGSPSVVGLVMNMVAFTPSNEASPLDQAGAEHAAYLFNQVALNATVRGELDEGLDGDITPDAERPDLAGMDFIGVNYYLRGRVTGLPAPADPAVPLLDFLPAVTYRWALAPTAPPCPTECSEFGSEIYPPGFRDVLATAGSYGLPIFVTENGIADSDDSQRKAYLVTHLDTLLKANDDGLADVHGYFHWSLIDNFEWTSGFTPKFGLAAVDLQTKERVARPSAALYGEIATSNRLTDEQVAQNHF
jgi:beta-glucosidase/6-phospho-beta-glucosidase/beta-galactosidase